MFHRYSLFYAGLLSGASAEMLPRMQDGFHIRSNIDRDVSLSYKETKICETTPNVKSYTGYIDIPANASEGRDFDIHTFFWFFEARNRSPSDAPLSLWLQGGPGAPSVQSTVGANGPCLVAPNSRDTNINPWSWNNEVNMLYMDQPVQTGFSYSTIVNGTIDETGVPYIVEETGQEGYHDGDVNATVIAGQFPSQNPLETTPTTATSALVAWHFMQMWMKQFPQYEPADNKISIWGESYAGHYAPSFADMFLKQSSTPSNPIDPASPLSCSPSDDNIIIPIQIDTLGLVNPCIDMTTQMPFYPEFAYNNTYGIQRINETQYKAAVDAWPGCKAKIDICRSLGQGKDPQELGRVEEVNETCKDAFKSCFKTIHGYYDPNANNVFDIMSVYPSSFPPSYAAGYLNDKTVQDALGVHVNFTGLSAAVEQAFGATGDFVRGHGLRVLGELLDQGVKVALMFGDRDYQCNWLGGEALSLAIEFKFSAGFHDAGYAELQTNESHVGGMVRQHDNLTFARIFEAGHEVPWYQPETAYAFFSRIMANKDAATGTISTSNCSSQPYYSTEGAQDVFGVNLVETPSTTAAEPEMSECYFWNMFRTCTPEQIGLAKSGRAVFEDYIMTGYVAEDGAVVPF